MRWVLGILHAACDFANGSIFGVAVAGASGQFIPGLLRAELHGPAVLTGGALVGEASAVAVVVVLAMAVVALLKARRAAIGSLPA